MILEPVGLQIRPCHEPSEIADIERTALVQSHALGHVQNPCRYDELVVIIIIIRGPGVPGTQLVFSDEVHQCLESPHEAAELPGVLKTFLDCKYGSILRVIGKHDFRSGWILQRRTRRPLRNPFIAARSFERGGPSGRAFAVTNPFPWKSLSNPLTWPNSTGHLS